MVNRISKGVKKMVKISDIEFDTELYPRTKPNWVTIVDYKESMVAGAKFPPIILAVHKKKLYLVDGKHRLDAAKQLGFKTISAIVNLGWTKQKIFQEAVRTNIAHGRPLAPYEKRLVIQKLLEMRMKRQDVSNLVQISIDKLDSFVGSRLVNAISGDEVDVDNAYETGEVILKSSLKHLAGGTVEGNINQIQKFHYSKTQKDMLKEFISLLESNTIDKVDKGVMKLIARIKTLLRKY